MNAPLKVRFVGMNHSDDLEALIRKLIEKLERRHARITSGTVVVSLPHRHHRRGNRFDVHIALAVPGSEVVVNREPGPDETHEDPKVAIRDAFEAAERKLDDLASRQRERARPAKRIP